MKKDDEKNSSFDISSLSKILTPILLVASLGGGYFIIKDKAENAVSKQEFRAILAERDAKREKEYAKKQIEEFKILSSLQEDVSVIKRTVQLILQGHKKYGNAEKVKDSRVGGNIKLLPSPHKRVGLSYE